MRVLIDTCVVMDAIQEREPFRESAQKIMLAAATRTFDGFLTAKAAADIHYLLHRHTHDNSETRKLLSKLFALLDLLDTTGNDCRQALSSSISDYEDAIMAETAFRTGMDCIVTRNEKDYRNAPVSVYSPAEFLQILSAAAATQDETDM